MSNLERGIQCSFCDKKQEDAKKIILSPVGRSSQVCICDECVAICVEIIEKDAPKESRHVFGMEMSDLERMESMGFITVDTIRYLPGSVVDFLLQLWNMMASAKRKLDEVEKTELGERIVRINNEVLMEGQSLESKKTLLKVLKKKLASLSKTAGE